MNYCILNGYKSTLIKGLLIQSLPPISKPLMRTTVEEIDGRDGDIVTELGYAAYDKIMTIGLFGDYDIDEVIAFFTSEGTVIFSNEPDKFYKYKIYGQIDFEKLIRFKTAKVTFHVQPFKFSAVDDTFTVSKNQMRFRPFSQTKDGVTVSVEQGVVSVSGTASADTEFYIPINEMPLLASSYTFNAESSGSGMSGCTVRVIERVPTDADSFGNTSIALDTTNTLTATLSTPKTFHYIWIRIASGTVCSFQSTFEMLYNALSSFEVLNRGNTKSKPTMTIYGAGEVHLSINNVEVFTLYLANLGYITLNAEDMNAYKDDALKNRSVSGNFNDLVLKAGMNTVSWTGNVTDVTIENVSRWI